ncbi:FAD-binding protein [Chloroflexota bacterium]
MPYPEELEKLKKKVEETRPERIARKRRGEGVPFMSLEERHALLLKYHPDYKEDGKREIKVGPNKGGRAAHEIVDLLEAKSRVDPSQVNLSRVDYETDVLVIGGGGAGTTAALLAQEHGAEVILATKLRHGDANTMMAEGGIQATTKLEKDSPAYHYIDTIGGGHFKNDPELVYRLVTEAPDVLRWLETLGAMFSKFPDGRFKTLSAGGFCRNRLHFCADITGAEIMRTLRDEARNNERIKVLEFLPTVELILNEYGHCAGALHYNMDTGEYLIIKAKVVILATGGCGRLHVQGYPTTNHYGATADGLFIGYRAGVKHTFMYTLQYHPTGVISPEQIEGLLITEKFRSAGADVLNADGEKFVNEMEPRDVEASAYIRECVTRGKGVPISQGKMGIWLDSPMIETLRGEGTVKREFIGKWKIFNRRGIDISSEPMLVSPVLHYQNGGLLCNAECETSVPGLFVAGEVAGGVHGENRLMGNSLLDILVFGRISGGNAAIYAREKYKEGKLTLEHVNAYHRELEDAGIMTDRVAPVLLPDYTNPEVKERQLPTRSTGIVR